jgi:ATP-dependent RNA helicase RhlE
MKFEKYPLCDALQANLAEHNYRRPTDIQFKTIPSVLEGEDVLAIAPTGTGKTAAFAIPIIEKIQSSKRSKRTEQTSCLVMVPTRELAQQIGSVFARLSARTQVNSFALYGGTEQDAQVEQLIAGVDILIATPGRMFDLIHQGFLKIEGIRYLVLDEADHMLDLGFVDDIRFVKKLLKQEHQTIFMSATIDKRIKKLAYALVKGNAIRIQVSPKDPVSKNIDHFVMKVKQDDKRFFLEAFLRDHMEAKVIVFVRTIVRAERVVKAMGRVDIEAKGLHSDMEQVDRQKILEGFRKGDFRLLVATDISARGIDIVDVDFVINYDLPLKHENYVHRVGRTGRGERRGTAISYCSKEEESLLEAIEEFLGNPINQLAVSKSGYRHVVESYSVATEGSEQGFEELEAFIQSNELSSDRRPKRREKKR